SPRVLNHVSLSYNRFNNFRDVFGDEDHRVDGAQKLGITGLSSRNGFPTVNWGGGPIISLANPQGGVNFGGSWAIGWGFLDTLSFSKGRHLMKVGLEPRRNHNNTRPAPWPAFNFNARATAIPNEAFSGNLTGYAFASYLLGAVDSATYGVPTGI